MNNTVKYITILSVITSLGGGVYAQHKINNPAKITFSTTGHIEDQGSRVIVYAGAPQTNGDVAVMGATDQGSPAGNVQPNSIYLVSDIPAGGDGDGTSPQGDLGSKAPTVAELVDFIHKAESSNGKDPNPYALHNICKSQGKSNEYGYGGMQKMICFDNPQVAKERVTKWVGDYLEKFGNAAQALCYYNLGNDPETGKPQVNCKYYQKFIGAM